MSALELQSTLTATETCVQRHAETRRSPLEASDPASGGTSATRDDAHDLVALSFAYGQRHKVELSAAKRLAEHSRVRKHLVSQTGVLREIGGSALTSDGIDVPQHDSHDGIGADIPVTYVPARNLCPAYRPRCKSVRQHLTFPPEVPP